MAKEGQIGGGALDSVTAAAQRFASRGPAPVHRWNPPYCGEIDLRIASDGTWFYRGTPIGRLALVALFASVLKREDDRYFLVTPVEKCGIVVEDAPFVAVEMRIEAGPPPGAGSPAGSGRIASAGGALASDNAARGDCPDLLPCQRRSATPPTAPPAPPAPTLHFRTNVDEWVACGSEHALRFEPEAGTGGLKPYLHVRHGLWAKVTRALFYDLVDRGEERLVDGQRMFGVASGDAFFAMAPADGLREYGL